MVYNKNLLPRDIVNAESQTLGAAAKYAGFRAIHAFGYDHTRPVVRWRLDRKSSFKDVGDTMLMFSGNPESGKIPPLYEDLAVFRFAKAAVDEYLREAGARPAVRYVLPRTAIMQGTSAEEIFGTDPDNPTLCAVAMGIGQNPLWANPGAHGRDGRFTLVPGLQVETEVVKRGELKPGITLL